MAVVAILPIGKGGQQLMSLEMLRYLSDSDLSDESSPSPPLTFGFRSKNIAVGLEGSQDGSDDDDESLHFGVRRVRARIQDSMAHPDPDAWVKVPPPLTEIRRLRWNLKSDMGTTD